MNYKELEPWGAAIITFTPQDDYLECVTRKTQVRLYHEGSMRVTQGNKCSLHPHTSLTHVKGLLGGVVLEKIEDWCKEKGYDMQDSSAAHCYIPQLALEFSYVVTSGLLFLNRRDNTEIKYWSTTFCLERTLQDVLSYLDKEIKK